MTGAGDRASAAETVILSRRDIAAVMRPADYLDAVEAGFRAAEEGKAQAPPPMAVAAAGGAFHAKAASLRLDRRYVALKLNGNFPANPARGLPTIRGAILLCDGEDGAVLAIMDSAEITVRRTAAATALAARFLARPDSRTVLVCGCGAQAGAQLEALREVLPSLARGFAWDSDPARAEALCRDAAAHGLELAAAGDLAGAAAQSDVIVACTTSQRPYLNAALVRPGTFVAAVGADSPEKNEIAPDLMARATVVCDVAKQCAEMGDLRHAIAAGAMRVEDVHAELGALLTGRRPGRTSPDEITLFDSTGTGLQDVACAALAFERARSRPGVAWVDLAG